jgi:hypothetical protein
MNNVTRRFNTDSKKRSALEPREKIKDGRTPTASRQASRHETKEIKADVSIMTHTGERRRFS